MRNTQEAKTMNEHHVSHPEMGQHLKLLQKRRTEVLSLEQIEKAYALTMSGMQATGDVGDTDLGTDLAEQEVALTLTGMEIRKLAKIDAAMERVRDGSYGVCEVCGNQIAERRLAVVPEATCCTKCDPQK